MNIRIAQYQDGDAIQQVHLSAFAESEAEMVAKLALDLLVEQTIPTTHSLVAEIDAAVVGHIAFSPVQIDSIVPCQGYILAPLGVKPHYQQRHIGSKLIESGMQQMIESGVNIVFVYGDPNYYRRFGFSVETARQYVPAYKLQYPLGWQARVLQKCGMEQSQSSVAISCVKPLSDPLLW